MIKEYAIKLINNFPETIKNAEGREKNIDLILDGGIFNGSYLFGALYFLKEMENRDYINIHRFSGCSIGSVAAILYLIDELDMVNEMYDISIQYFKKERNLKIIDDFLKKIKEKLPEDICEKVSGRLFVTYYNIEKGKKIVKSNFKNTTELIETIRKSCFVPFMINGDLLHKNKYLDGIFPYIFNNEDNENNNRIMYIDLFGSDKIKYLLSIKNENGNFHRLLTGMLDVHLFFIKKTSTQMCSFINEWNLIDFFHHRIKKYLVENIILLVVYFIYYAKKYFPCKLYNQSIFFKIISKIIEDIYVIIIENYCF